MTMALNGTWIDHFPENYSWSNATLVCKGMAPYGAVAIEEIDRIGERLKERAGEPHAWAEEWSAMASHLEEQADAAAAHARDMTAGNYYIRAGNYFFTGERFIPPGEAKLAMYKKALRCFHAGLERRHRNIERVDVPYDGSALAAYFMKAPGVSGKARTVVLFNGMDNCKEMSVLFAGLEFAARGMHTLAIDGPGQGESLRLRKIHTRYDYEAAGTAAYNYVASRADVDPKKVTVMGYSFGGYYAPRIVAFDKRYAACVAFGAMHASIYEWVLKIKTVTQSDSTKSAQSAFQVPWVFGAKDIDEALEMSKRFDLEGVAQRIECPVLVVHGEKDRIVPLDSARKLYDMIGSKRKTYKIFTAEDGGAEHCQVDNRQVGIDYIADWIAANT
jgi:alpha-beta hydrolase superfamily lysophospholipase